MKTHWRSIGLRNAGINFPACYARVRLLDLDKSRLLSTGDHDKVTCKRCLVLLKEWKKEIA